MRFNEKIVDVFAKRLCPEHSVSANFARSAVLEVAIFSFSLRYNAGKGRLASHELFYKKG